MKTNEHQSAAKTLISRITTSPITWVVIGIGLGLGLGINSTAPWLISLGLVAWAGNMLRYDPKLALEDIRVLGGPGFLLSWTGGVVIRGALGLD